MMEHFILDFVIKERQQHLLEVSKGTRWVKCKPYPWAGIFAKMLSGLGKLFGYQRREKEPFSVSKGME